MTATGSSKTRYELILKNEGDACYTDFDAKGTEKEILEQAEGIARAARRLMTKGTWTVEVWTSPDNSDGNLRYEIQSDGSTRTFEIPKQADQTSRKGSTVTFRSESERLTASAFLTNCGMKGLTDQVITTGTTLRFTDAETAKQAVALLDTIDIRRLAAKLLKK